MTSTNATEVLKIIYDLEVTSQQMPLFKAAMDDYLNKIQSNNHLFGGGSAVIKASQQLTLTKYQPGYPLFQCKTRRSGNRQQPVLLLLGGCAEIGEEIFQEKAPQKINLLDQEYTLKECFHQHFVFINYPAGRWYQYELFDYLALEGRTLERYKSLTDHCDKITYLNSILKGHVLNFVGAVGWMLEAPLEVYVDKILNEEEFLFNKRKYINLSLTFFANISIPDFTGLGKEVQEGMGTIRKKFYGS